MAYGPGGELGKVPISQQTGHSWCQRLHGVASYRSGHLLCVRTRHIGLWGRKETAVRRGKVHPAMRTGVQAHEPSAGVI